MMAVTNKLIQIIRDRVIEVIGDVSFQVSGITKTTKVSSIGTDTSGRVVVKAIVDSSHSGLISNIKLLDKSGNELIVRMDVIDKNNINYPRGLILIFAIEVKEVI